MSTDQTHDNNHVADEEDILDVAEFDDVSAEPTSLADELDSAEDGEAGGRRGFASGPKWARAGVLAVAGLLAFLLGRQLLSGSDSKPAAASTATSSLAVTGTTVAAGECIGVDPLLTRPKLDYIVAKIIGPTCDARQRVADRVALAESVGADLCSLYLGVPTGGWAIEFQRPGGPALPNATYSRPLFIDGRCVPTVTSPLPAFAALPAPPTTSTAPGATPARTPLNPTVKD